MMPVVSIYKWRDAGWSMLRLLDCSNRFNVHKLKISIVNVNEIDQ